MAGKEFQTRSLEVKTALLALEINVRELHDALRRLQPPLNEATQRFTAIGIQQQAGLATSAVSELAQPWSIADVPLQPLATTELELASRRAVLQGGLERAGAMRAGMAALIQELHAVERALAAGVGASNTWAGLLRARHSRWVNDQPGSRLLSLPPNALHSITRKAGTGRQCRLACSALRHAYGTPGTAFHCHLHLVRYLAAHPRPWAASQPSQVPPPAFPTTGYWLAVVPPSPAAAALLDASIARWPHPEGVTRVDAIHPLQASTCAAVTRAFPNLRHLALASGCMPGAHTALSPNVTNLEMCMAMPHSAWIDLGGVAHFTALQALSLSACGHSATEGCLAALTSLVHLSSLTLQADAGRFRSLPTGLTPKDAVGEGWYTGASTQASLGLWKVLAALERLARLSVDVAFDFHTPMPEVAAMTALTHLGLWCTKEMVGGQGLHAVEAPVLQLLQLVPNLASLQLWQAGQLATCRAPNSRVQVPATVAEAIRSLDLVRLELSGPLALTLSRVNVTPLLTPSLTTFIATVTLPLTPEAALLMLPSPLPITAIDIAVDSPSGCAADVSGTLAVLAQQLPELTSLRLQSPMLLPPHILHMSHLQDAQTLAPAMALSLLAKLRHLHIGTAPLAQYLAPALSTLAHLTSLELPGGVCPAGLLWLLPLTRLRSLSLGRMRGHGGIPDTDIQCHLEAVRQMRGLTELVLDYLPCKGHPPRSLGSLPLFEALVPPPAMLRRLVLGSRQMLDEAEGAWGRYVDEIRLAPSEERRLRNMLCITNYADGVGS